MQRHARRLQSLAATARQPEDFFAFCDDALPAVRRLARFDGACVLAFNPATGLPAAHTDRHGIPPERGARLMELEYGEPDVASFADLGAQGRVAVDVHRETGGRPWTAARRFEEVLEPSDRPYEARVVLAHGADVRGGMALFRDAGGGPFSPAELAALRAAGPKLGRGIRRAMLATEARRADRDAPGALLFDGAGALVATTGRAAWWLARLPDRARWDGIPLQLTALVSAQSPPRRTLGRSTRRSPCATTAGPRSTPTGWAAGSPSWSRRLAAASGWPRSSCARSASPRASATSARSCSVGARRRP